MLPFVGAAADALHGAQGTSKLAKQLASEEGVAELLSGRGLVIAGKGSNKEIKDVGRLVSTYGGKAEDWSKLTSSAKERMQTHAYRNEATGELVELKSMIP